MEFIDSTGHIFSLPSYEDNPINLEYVEGDYIFWLKDSTVSINNYYIKPIRFLLDEKLIKDSIYFDDNNEVHSYFTLEISNSSQFYKLIGPKYLQEQLEDSKNISKPVGLDKSQFVDKLTLDDFYFDLGGFVDLDGTIKEYDDKNLVITSGTTNNKFYMFPFYVVGFSEIEGTFLNNITIKYTYQKETSREVIRNYTRDEYYDLLVKDSLSNIKIYSYDPDTQTKSNEPVVTIPSGFNSEKYTQGINVGFNKYEILYSGDPYVLNKRTDNILSTAYDQDDPQQDNQYKRIRNFLEFSNGQFKLFGNMFTDSYHFIYRLENELPEGWYVFEGEIKDGCNYCGSILSTNHDGYIEMEDGELYGPEYPEFCQSTYPGDDQYENINDKYCTEQLIEINSQYEKVIIGEEEDWNWNRNEFVDKTGNVMGYTIRQTPVYLHKTRDFWLDVDNRAFAENTNGKTITEVEFEMANIYTPITVGCTFIDECEELIINGRNMGIRLPKEILKAIYSSSFYSKNADEKLLKNKLKELLLNYMNIKGQTGNVKSMLNSLKWFGWNKYIEISQLLKTDNQFQNQFILDYFDIYNDVKDTFKYFNRTNNISLTVLSNKETGENYQQNYTEKFIGEGKPKLENLFDKTVEVVKDDITFYKPYYNFIFNELALKLDCLKYYYQQYFLPVHISINRASIAHKVYANTTKLSAIGYSTTIDKPVYLPDNANNINVVFPDTNRLVFKQSNHIIDDKFNEFSNYNDNYAEDLYYVNENCVIIPITIENNSYEYIEDQYGIYYLDGKEYIRIEYFYKRDGNNYELITDLENDLKNATHYRQTLFQEIQELSGITRYSKISKLYSQDIYGDYYRDIDGNYIKINYFYKMISEKSGKLSNRFEGTHYSLVKNKDIKKIESDFIRYSKISEGYFTCKLILTATTFNKNPLGHYVKIDGKYLYKENFYKNDFTNMEDLISERDIDDSGNYIKMYNEFIRINKEDRYDIDTIYLINNDNFNYYQSPDQYYKNFILIPRLLNNTLDYEKAYFRLSLLVNDKWFKYDFRIVTPNVYLDLGKLEYKYEITHEDNKYYPFKQLKSLNPLRFNAFMFEPDLITINALFKEDSENDNSKVLTFIDKLLQMDDGTHNPNQHKMYEFYKKYYSNVIKVPYNTKYYNRIHVFDIYTKENKIYGGLDYVVKIEGFGAEGSWGDEWSPVNGGKDNIIYGFQRYREYIGREYPGSYIICYRSNGITFTITEETLGNDIPAYNDGTGNVEYIELYDGGGTLIETLYSYYGYVFDDLYLVDSGFNWPIDHSHRYGPWWYTKDIINTTQEVDLKKLKYENIGENNEWQGGVFSFSNHTRESIKQYINEHNFIWLLFGFNKNVNLDLSDKNITYYTNNYTNDINNKEEVSYIVICRYKEYSYELFDSLWEAHNLDTQEYYKYKLNPIYILNQYCGFGDHPEYLNDCVDYIFDLLGLDDEEPLDDQDSNDENSNESNDNSDEENSDEENSENNSESEEPIEPKLELLNFSTYSMNNSVNQDYQLDQFNNPNFYEDYKKNYMNFKYQELYKEFFNNDCSCKLLLDENIPYDYYLMHDNKEWYMVAISQLPIASYPEADLLNIHRTTYDISKNYRVIYADYSLDKFLVNRMVIKRANGYNQFNKDDLIIVGVNNNDYQFNIDLNNKWTILPIYDINKAYNVNSNTNLMIIPNNNTDNLYTPGYYNVELRYTINGLNNILHNALAQYKVLNEYKDIIYPEIKEQEVEEETFDIRDVISDGTILFANSEGKRKYVKDSTTYIEGYHPIGIKIVNAGYFAPDSPAIYMGLRHLSITDPENGRREAGNLSNFASNYPYFGMGGIEIDIKTYDKLCYFDSTHRQKVVYLSPPTDDFSKLPTGRYGAINDDGTPKYPAPNNRAYRNEPTTTPSSSAVMTILNDDDTLNMDLLDDTCALLDWDGKTNNEIIKNSWYNENGEMIDSDYANWQTVQTMYNPMRARFSPAIACALRYHTYGTNPGDWYVPSYACVFFMIYNFKRYSEIFENLNRNYPDDCKPDLLEINYDAFYTCTFPPTQTQTGNDMWDIHVCSQVCHIFSRTAQWYTIPFINIDESDKDN